MAIFCSVLLFLSDRELADGLQSSGLGFRFWGLGFRV